MDLSHIRRTNLLQLFSEFVALRMADAPADQISGLDREFAVAIQVHNSYFSGMKSGSRTIGGKLARQVETLRGKAKGWLDEPHEAPKPAELATFLRLAEQMYSSAPGLVEAMAQSMREAIAMAGASKQSGA